jgi:hypothetical protein
MQAFERRDLKISIRQFESIRLQVGMYLPLFLNMMETNAGLD